ncbi:hypothetical protein [Hufsiella ginkgonis]|uniref:Uncharacterized protein n=1 Tax=Hufsiella ginkgonis TaxID=2695274 RepID=A0A7K1XWS6_9SPHI|nr:hypothetical protein [Hufsiella ginkgonis]MXV15267.1 hypothetical protein [Hufsiella ginkgonis]
MKDFEELKNIWHGQAELPRVSYEEVLSKVKKTRLVFSNKLLLQVVSLSLAIALMVLILFKVDFRLDTSYLAIVIFILCCLFYLYVQVRDYRKISRSETLLEMPEEYISYLKSYKQARYILNTRIYRIYMLFMGIGFALYFIEVFFFVSMVQTLIAVAFTVAWFFVCYYVFMRMYIRKEEARLNEMIGNLERLKKQFEVEEV